MFTLHVVVVVVARGCLYEMSWPAFPPGSAHALFLAMCLCEKASGPLAQIPIARAEIPGRGSA